MKKEKTKHKNRSYCLLMAICFMLMAALITVEPVSAASYKVKAVNGKTSITISNGQSAIACTSKAAKKGQVCKLKAIKNSSAKAKTLYYGKSKGWSNAKIAKALKKGKRYKIQVPNTWTFANVSLKGKVRYVAFSVKKAVQPEQPADEMVSKNPPAQKPPANDQSANECASKASTGTLAVDITSTDSSYNTEAYSLKGQIAVISGKSASQRLFLDANGDGAAEVPPGTYEVGLLTIEQYDAPAYQFGNCTYTVNVQADKTATVKIAAEPVPCKFYALCSENPDEVSLHCEENGKDITLESKDCFEMSPFEADIPAGDYTIKAGDNQQRVRTTPGWYSVEL